MFGKAAALLQLAKLKRSQTADEAVSSMIDV
jgi:hypothetical protein